MTSTPTGTVVFPFDSCSRLEVVELGELTGLSRQLNFNWDGRPATLRFERVPSPQRGASWVIEVELEGHAFDICLRALPEISWIAPELAGLKLEGLPEELGAGILQVCVESVLSNSGIGLDLKVLGVSHVEEELKQGSFSVGWSISRGTREKWMAGLLTGDADSFRFLKSKVSEVPPSPCRPCDDIPILIDLSVGRIKCSVDDLQALEVNDVLMGEFSEFMDKGTCRLVAGSRPIAYGEIGDDGVKITGFFGDSSGGNLESIQSPDLPLEESSSVEIRLDFVVDRLALRVSQLSSLQLGSVIGGTFSKPSPVSVVSDGQKLALGEFVPVGRRNGVRITRLFER
jgi:flagellar motor switch/type III secretory pathway protein FliN